MKREEIIMPTNHDYIQKWLDEMFNHDPFVELEKIAKKCGIEVDNKKQTITVKNPVSPFEIQSVLSNRKKNAFTVVWADGTSTVVHCQPGDEWDDEKALAMCFTKKALGNKGNFNDKFNDALDNKMKVIPAEPAPEKATEQKDDVAYFTRDYFGTDKTPCTCDGTCEECGCKAEAEKFIEEIETLKKKKNAFGINKQAAEDLQKAALKATSSFTEMVKELAEMSTPKPSKTEKTPLYRIFIRISGKSHHDSDFTSIEALRKRVHEIAEEYYGRKPYYYRSWMGDNGRMIIDFGHYTQFIEIEGITPSEYAKN